MTALTASQPGSPSSCSPRASRTATPRSRRRRARVDEMEKCGHYDHWRTDFDCVEELGIRFLRYGPPLHRTWLGHGRYDWEFADADLRRAAAARHHADRRPVPLRRARLDRQLPEPGLPRALRRLRRAPSRGASPGCSSTRRSTRCSSAPPFSAAYGWWNEQLHERPRPSSPRSSTSSRPTCWPCTRSSSVRPDAIFIQSESSEYFHADSPAAIEPAEIMNARALPVARPELRPPRRLATCTSTCSTTA